MGVRITVRHSVYKPNSTKTITRKIQYRVNSDGSITKSISRTTTPKSNVTTG